MHAKVMTLTIYGDPVTITFRQLKRYEKIDNLVQPYLFRLEKDTSLKHRSSTVYRTRLLLLSASALDEMNVCARRRRDLHLLVEELRAENQRLSWENDCLRGQLSSDCRFLQVRSPLTSLAYGAASTNWGRINPLVSQRGDGSTVAWGQDQLLPLPCMPFDGESGARVAGVQSTSLLLSGVAIGQEGKGRQCRPGRLANMHT